MPLQSLGYLSIASDRLEDWADFGTRLLGLQLVERSRSGLVFRMDDRAQRIVVSTGQEAPNVFGWEVAGPAALDALAARLDAADIAVRRQPPAVAEERRVTEIIAFADPLGNRLEAFHGAQTSAEPYRPARPLSGFRTGALGMGHAVLHVERIDQVRPFYEDVLGFRLSDYTLSPYKVFFFHINARHHSLALVESGRRGIHHIMMELFSLDDVGQAYDLALAEDGRVSSSLGRHTNDFMTSFYARSPSGFAVEYGWGGRCIDPASWQAHESTHGASFWGHERPWLPAEQRAEIRRLRDAAAADGLRAPVQVMPGNYHVSPGVCPWWDGMRQAAGEAAAPARGVPMLAR